MPRLRLQGTSSVKKGEGFVAPGGNASVRLLGLAQLEGQGDIESLDLGPRWHWRDVPTKSILI
jgi:hypothetical protein